MDYTQIINNGRVTEKATDAIGGKAYVFNVSPLANKKEVAKAVFAIYKVRPVKVNILKIPRKATFAKGRKGAKGGGKKAVVYLKPEDKIEFI